MNETLQTILTRRSIRAFKPDMLPRETIDAIIEAGLYAPSGMNTHALGVGSCWIHRAAETFAMPHWQELLTSLGLTGDYEGIGNCVLGYAACDLPAAPARKEGRVFYAE